MKYLLLLMMLLCSPCLAADINWSLNGTASGSGGNDGVPNNVKDNNTSSYYGVNGTTSAIPYTATVTFDKTAFIINNVNILNTYIIIGLARSVTLNVDLFYGGTWNTVITRNTATIDKSGNPVTYSATGPWFLVEGIRVTFTGGASDTGFGAAYSNWSHELRAFGPINKKGNYAFIM